MRQNPLYQSELWEDFQKALNQECHRLDGVLVLVKHMPLGKVYLDVQRASLTEVQLQKIKDFAREKQAVFVRWSPNEAQVVPAMQARLTKAHRFPELSLVLDLTKTEEELLAGMSQSGRRHLRQAQKANLEVTEERDAQVFYQILTETTSRQGFSGHGVDFYQNLVDSGAKMLVVRHEGQALASGIFANSGEMCTYLYGASSNVQRKLQAPTLMQWTAIQQARQEGLKFYDFFGIAPLDDEQHPWYGVSRFKRKFGGTEVVYAPEQEFILRPFWYGAVQAARACWRWLPV